jgi:phenylalanyl-tRNA synthetase beta chain
MRISDEWLAEWVSLPPENELEQLFEMAGIGVDERRHDGPDGAGWSLEVTSNRGDCLCAVGLAREIAAATGARLRTPYIEVPEADAALGPLQIEIEDPEDCALYASRVVDGVRIGPSPDWMRARLEAAGMRTVNAVVDATNYVMLELGQPLHAFDAAKLSTGNGALRIGVRRAREGEKITTLDGVERALGPQVVAVTDGERPIAVAGVMGGQDSEVSEATQTVLLESAWFHAPTVRRGRRAIDLHSEASRRFERGVDPGQTLRALDRAAQLIAEVAGGRVRRGVAVLEPRPFVPRTVRLRAARCNQVLGLALDTEEMAVALERLGFVVARGESEMEARVPSWRRDIEREIDLIEEVARAHGYGRVPAILPRTANATAGRALPHRLQEKARGILNRCGLSEIVTYSLESAGEVERAGLPARAAVRLRNPLSEDLAQLRTSLLPSLLGVLERNARTRVRLFELAKVYIPRRDEAPEAEQPDEILKIGIALLDVPSRANWAGRDESVDFWTLKACVENLLRGMNATGAEFRTTVASPFHPGRCATVAVDGQELGVLGEVHPSVAHRYGLVGRAFLAQLDFAALVSHAAIAPHSVPIARFPASERDIALVVHDEVPAARVRSVLREAGGTLLEEVEVFDVYTGAPIPPGSKSLALWLRFRSPDRTLLEDEVEAAMSRVRTAAADLLGAELRA